MGQQGHHRRPGKSKESAKSHIGRGHQTFKIFFNVGLVLVNAIL